jgi:tetratricopeptide (TPR) repeat protein
VFVALYAISLALFFVAERYRLPLLVALCISAGAAVAELPQAFRKRNSPLAPRALNGAPRISIATALVAAAAGAVLTAWPFDVPDGRFEERLRLSKAYMNRRDYAAAVTELENAYKLRPADTVTEFNLGMALVSSGRAEEGIAHVRHAVDAGVPVNGARYALASALLTIGDREGAVALLRSYYPANDESAESCYQVARLAMSAGAPRVAERYLQRALQLRPGWPEALAALERVSR